MIIKLLQQKYANFLFNLVLILVFIVTISSSSLSSYHRPASDEVPVIGMQELEGLLEQEENQILILNFWATWCAPCIKELPVLESLTEKYKPEDLEVILLSLDFPHQKETKLIPFIEKRRLKSKVMLVDITDQDKMINLVDPSWTGAIPATLFLNPSQGKRIFHEGLLSAELIEKYVAEVSN